MENVTLSVQGMTCMGCVESVRRVISPIPGVLNANVSLEKNQVAIDYDPTQARVEQFTQAIEDAGFEVADGAGAG